MGGGAEGPSWHLHLRTAFCPRPLHILQGGSMTWGVENFVSQGALNIFLNTCFVIFKGLYVLLKENLEYAEKLEEKNHL